MRVITLIELIILVIVAAIVLSLATRVLGSIWDAERRKQRGLIQTALIGPPPPVLTTTATLTYEIALNARGTKVLITTAPPGSVFSSYLQVTVVFVLVGPGGARFVGGGRNKHVPMNLANGLATAEIEPAQTGSDRLQVQFIVAEKSGANPAIFTDPTEVPFETVMP